MVLTKETVNINKLLYIMIFSFGVHSDLIRTAVLYSVKSQELFLQCSIV